MLPSIAQLARLYNLQPQKKYGQNFLYDENLCDRIAQIANITTQSQVLEIGPGPAGLTRSILKRQPASLQVIETDARCLPLLEHVQRHYPILIIHHGDALQTELSQLITANAKLTIIANLPYNIGTALLVKWLQQIQYIESINIMLQREVVERIVALPNTKTYGRLAILCQLCCTVEKAFDISPKAFYPPPKIWSSVVRLVPKIDIPNQQTLNKIAKITQAAFSARRKMLKTALRDCFEPHNLVRACDDLNIDPNCRPENLTPEQYQLLAKYL